MRLWPCSLSVNSDTLQSSISLKVFKLIFLLLTTPDEKERLSIFFAGE
jgi:hypothetical protein